MSAGPRDLILFHYALSPFSEKVRLMLGHGRLPWRSVIVGSAPPRPGLDILAGGYRRIPVALSGADVFCDSWTIAAEVARRAGRPELDGRSADATTIEFMRLAELKVFTAVLLASPTGILGRIVRDASLLTMLKFLKDRLGIARKARLPRMSPRKANSVIAGFVSDLEARLSSDFLCGDQPVAADFSAFTPLWFARNAGRRDLDGAPKAAAWFRRMQDLGHGARSDTTMEQALDEAKSSDPAPLADGLAVATPGAVSIAPRDYARDPVSGVLVGEDNHRWVLRREHPRTGALHLHFPRAGFSLRGG